MTKRERWEEIYWSFDNSPYRDVPSPEGELMCKRIAALEAERTSLRRAGLNLFTFAQRVNQTIKRHKLQKLFPEGADEYIFNWIKAMGGDL
jgi:hypothetical protein